jgi:hypothetical protein
VLYSVVPVLKTEIEIVANSAQTGWIIHYFIGRQVWSGHRHSD